MCPEGLAEKTTDQAEWGYCPLWQKECIHTLMNKPGWRRLGSGLAGI